MKATRNLIFLDFGHKRLNKRSRVFRHEISHLTKDMVDVIRKINQNLSVCLGTIKILGSQKQAFRIKFGNDSDDEFHNLLYNLENFVFRLHAYRDKLCIFINYVMRLGYSDSDLGLLDKLINHDQIKLTHIDTELRRFSTGVFSELLRTRKALSHAIYYENYNPYFMPKDSPKKEGFHKAARAWTKKISLEVQRANDCMEEIFQINEHISNKLLNYLNK